MTSYPSYSEQARTGCGLIGGGAQFAHTASAPLIVAIFTPLGLLANPAVRRVLLAITVLGISFPVGRQLGYREDAGNLGSLGGLLINATTLGLIGLYVPLLVKVRRGAQDHSRRRPHPSVPLALYVVFVALSLFAAKDVELGFYELFMLIQTLFLHFYIVNFAACQEDVRFVFRVLLIGLTVHGLLMIGAATVPDRLSRLGGEAVVDNSEVLEGWTIRNIHVFGARLRVDEKRTSGSVRVGGLIGSPNDTAGFLSVCLMLALGVLMASLGRRDKLIALVTLILGSTALMLTLSRGGWCAFALGLVIIGVPGLRRGRISGKAVIAVALAFAAVSLIFSGTISSRLTGDDEGAATSRIPLLKLAALMIEDHPLLGVGANNFPVAMEPYLTRGFSGQFIYCVHNKYLLVWSETGLGALIAFLWFLLATLRRGIRCWRYGHNVFSPLALGCAAGLVGHMFHMSVDVFRGHATIELLVLVAGLIAVLERLAADRFAVAQRHVLAGVRRVSFSNT